MLIRPVIPFSICRRKLPLRGCTLLGSVALVALFGCTSVDTPVGCPANRLVATSAAGPVIAHAGGHPRGQPATGKDKCGGMGLST